MKKIIILLFVCILSICLFACGEKEIKPDLDKVNEVVEVIDLLPNKVTLSDKDDVDYANDLYSKLTEDEKKLVGNYETLALANERIEYYKNESSEVEKAVAKAKAYLEATIPTSVDYTVSKIELPMYYEVSNAYEKYNINFSWTSSDPYTIDTVGNVNHDISDLKVTLTCKLTTRKMSNIEDFKVDVNVGHVSFKPLNKKVISGYIYNNYPGFNESDRKTLDIVYVCFAQIREKNNTYYVDTNGINFLNSIREIRNDGIRCVLSIGGWQDDKNAWIPYQEASKTEEGRKQVAASCLDVLKRYHLDGIDMDWEYPRSSDRSNYTLLMTEIKNTLKAVNKEYLVTAAIPSGTWISSNYNLTDLNSVLDYLNLMSYDLDDSSKTSHMCALYNSTYASGSADSGAQYIAKNGFSKSKIVIGAAFYGRKFTNVGPTNNGLNQTCDSKSSIRFNEIYNNYLKKVGNGTINRYYDSTAHAYYIYDSANKVFISYDDPEAIKEKCDYVIKNGYGGIMYWSYTDDNSGVLMKALYEKLNDMKK